MKSLAYMLPWALLAVDPSTAMARPAATAADPSSATIAAAFGARDGVARPSLSPDGKSLVYITAGAGQVTMAQVMNLTTGDTKMITYADGKPLHLEYCGWSAANRLLCELYGISKVDGRRVSWTRMVALDADGGNNLAMGRDRSLIMGVPHQYDGHVLDWMDGTDGKIMMVRGLGVEIVDTRTGKGEPIKPPVGDGWTDGSGVIRIIGTDRYRDGALTGASTYRYRLRDETGWKLFSHVDADGHGLTPLAVDGTRNLAYALQKLDGRDALYSVALDGSMKTDLVFADPHVDVDNVETIGRHGRVIGLHYTTDRRQVVYFDPAYRTLVAMLAKTLPQLPKISFTSASADEKRLLLFAQSDVDAGHYYVFDRDTHHLTEVLVPRPQLGRLKLSEQRSITYKAADGTVIPAYLTLPPDGPRKGLPAIVMPHGGPASRDDWGFDWLAQYFAQRGFAVIQPEYRGSTGYGDAFFNKSGFQSWRTAIGDVLDSGRWLIAEGIADPRKLAVFGWSYGGYAALQANTVDPALFKAVVAVAPVTDLTRLKDEASGFTNHNLVDKFVGRDSEWGSPDRHAQQFKAPVLLFHGDQDINVDIAESRAMDAALHKAGKQSRLVIYPGLDHQIDDAAARTDLLTQAEAFLRAQW